jgi:phosphoribosylamine--glycine ligase
VAPGNAGTAGIARNIDIKVNDIKALVNFASIAHVDFTFVGPEGPLAEGIVDQFSRYEMPIFGPTRAAAQIESSKIFAKRLMHKYHIPCAASQDFSSYTEALAYLEKQTPPIVIKADGLAAGKGVTVAFTLEEARAALEMNMLQRSFGSAGDRVVIEEYLTGLEMSAFIFSDGNTVVPLVPACDYKRAMDNDMGPNTGGMGSYSPPIFYNEQLGEIVYENIMQPAIKAMASEGMPYIGVLYGGLMITRNGPKVIEFNARLGDPETQVILPRLKTDLADIALAVLNHRLNDIQMDWSEDACAGVVMTSGGYPGSYKTGYPIYGLQDIDADVMAFHAGTRLDDNGKVITAGGRVLTLVATGKTLASAREKVYNNISRIKFEGCYYRRDIAQFE